MMVGRHFNRMKAFILLGVYVLFLLFVGTQVQENLAGIGKPIGEFLTQVANWIGERLHMAPL
jgi:hypothetical protein